MNVLLTGGLGYIGSNIVSSFLNSEYTPVIFDNLSNSSIDYLDTIKEVYGANVEFIEGDLRDKGSIHNALSIFNVDAVIHLAGLKSVSESVADPDSYYENNVVGSKNLIQSMEELKIFNLVFSSSATVYGVPQTLPIDESHPLNPINPYGQYKMEVESIIQDCCNSNQDFRACILRYFNPVGAHKSGLLGEFINKEPNNIMPIINLVALGQKDHIGIYGDDYETNDGTGIRDYIHITDLSEAHISALEFTLSNINQNCSIFNLGTGKGCSVLELVKIFEKTNNIHIPIKVLSRRPGDISESVASPNRANKQLHWHANRGLKEMCESSYKFYQNNSVT